MEITVEICDALVTEARRVADRRGVTLGTLVEEGLRHVLETDGSQPRFTLRDGSFTGTGIDPQYAGGGWDRVRDAIYEGRGA